MWHPHTAVAAGGGLAQGSAHWRSCLIASLALGQRGGASGAGNLCGHIMGQLLWSWVLWGLWVLPGECRGRLRHRGSRTHHGAKEARGSVLQQPAWWGGEMGTQWITVGSKGLVAQPALAHTQAPPGNVGAAGMGPLVPAQDPAEPVGSSHVPDSISAEQHQDMSPTVPELGTCQLSPGRTEKPSVLGDGSGNARLELIPTHQGAQSSAWVSSMLRG
ncbi:uncharacterized protein LOC109369364 [Meleagris gallopavo]|uniref:uncharacterized protein LOC109369364 n=1 Tax=Meleagris gallopavo TaxID=9103 RepID=UPI0012AC47E2|nr:uncharacterized protein LOC109369364 [Meleagris gallopavo]